MHYMAVTETDIGTTKKVNQDSLLVKHAVCGDKELLLAAVCDGVGGLSQGELASSAVVRELGKWFDGQLAVEMANPDMEIIGEKLSLLLRELNVRIRTYGEQNHERLGTTATGILFVNDRYAAFHVGDTRLYHLADKVRQLTDDQTVTAREVRCGRMSAEEAAKDKRRHTLLQAVGTSKTVRPQILLGQAEEGLYIICSDGFWQKTEEAGSWPEFCRHVCSETDMHEACRRQIGMCRSMGETDNISVSAVRYLPFEKKEILKAVEKQTRKQGRTFLMIKEIVCTWKTEKEIQENTVTDFDTFYRENYPKVCSWLKNKVSDPEDAEDIASEAFAYYYRNQTRYDQKKSSPVTWLYVIVTSRWKNYMRDKKVNDDIAEMDLPGDSDIEQAYDLQELRDAIARALLMLPERQRTIVVLSYFQGRNSNEIAALLGISAANVRMELSRALRKLREPLKEYYL